MAFRTAQRRDEGPDLGRIAFVERGTHKLKGSRPSFGAPVQLSDKRAIKLHLVRFAKQAFRFGPIESQIVGVQFRDLALCSKPSEWYRRLAAAGEDEGHALGAA